MNNLTRIIRYNKPNPKIIPKITTIMLNAIICVWLIFAFPLSVYASDHGGGGSTSEPTTSWTDEQKADYFKTNFSRLLARVVGVVRGSDSADSVFNSFKNLYYTDTIQQNMTWEQWLAQDLGWTFDDKGEPTITLSVNCQNAMQQAVDEWIDTQGYFYAYSLPISDFVSHYNNKESYDKIVSLLDTNEFVGIYVAPSYHFLFDDNFGAFVYDRTVSSGSLFSCNLYDKNWSQITPYWRNNDDTISQSKFSSLQLSSTPYLQNYSNWYYVVSKKSQRFKVFRSLDSFKADSVGTQTYYITNDYSKGSTYNTTKTIDNSTIQNTISYDTVQNFNQQYYDEHNTTANYETINNYINNYYETINNNGGGGSGGGSGDSGGGIFDWLGSVGEILGSLIKGLGEIVVGLLDGISSVITSFIDTLPTQVNNLFGTLFDWLPPEIRSLIVLSITLSLIWGIIKLIRG